MFETRYFIFTAYFVWRAAKRSSYRPGAVFRSVLRERVRRAAGNRQNIELVTASNRDLWISSRCRRDVSALPSFHAARTVPCHAGSAIRASVFSLFFSRRGYKLLRARARRRELAGRGRTGKKSTRGPLEIISVTPRRPAPFAADLLQRVSSSASLSPPFFFHYATRGLFLARFLPFFSFSFSTSIDAAR